LHDNIELRQQVGDLLKDPIFKVEYDLKMMEYRELNFQRLKKVAEAGVIKMRELVRFHLSYLF
jgi:hypothetical protein